MIPQEMQERLNRLSGLRTKGVDPYPAGVTRSHEAKAFLEQFEGLQKLDETIELAGRIIARRRIGALSFLRLMDASGVVQVVLRSEDLGASYEEFLDSLDVGDWVKATGKAYVTKTGEHSLKADSVQIVCKALRPLPEKWHGLTDVEQRYRHRELDLISNPEVRNVFIARSKMISAIRRFLDQADFLEVETPILQDIPGGASARPFVTHHNALNIDLYLRIAPELYLKRLLVGGFEKIYEIGRCFRNEGIDYAHNPEFTMLEMYWAFVGKEEYLNFLEEMIKKSILAATGKLTVVAEEGEIDFSGTWPRVTFRDAIISACEIDIALCHSGEDVMAACKKAGLKIDFKGCVGLGEYLDTLYKETARKNLLGPIWVFDYPIDLKPLARQHPLNPRESASAQLIVRGAEIVNAYYHELNDAADQRARLLAQQDLRDQGSEEAQWLDEPFLEALEVGMPPAAGMGIGLDRLAALITGSHSLKEVLLFPTMRGGGE